MSDDNAENAQAIRWRVEAACDGYAALAYDDVPAEWCYDADAYMAGAAAAAESIRQVTTPPAAPECEVCGMPADRCTTVPERSSGAWLNCCDNCTHSPAPTPEEGAR